MIHLDKATPEMLTIIRKTFPDYRGRKFKIDNSGHPVGVTSYWDGGSRDYFVAYNLATGKTMPVPQNGTPFDGGPIAPDGVPVPPGFLIVEHSIFCGKDSGITFHVNTADLPPFLPAPVELTDDETVVLDATQRYKNTYSGETNLRFKETFRGQSMANGVAQFNGKPLPFPQVITMSRWETAKSALIARRFLNKAGAITADGRNAVARS